MLVYGNLTNIVTTESNIETMKRKNLLFSAAILSVLICAVSCKGQGGSQNGTSGDGQENTKAVASEKIAEEEYALVVDRACEAFYLIPDHNKVSEEAEPFFSKDLYASLVVAWDLPRWVDGEIGNEEFLYYFVTGNGGELVDKIELADITSVENGVCTVDISYSSKSMDGTPNSDWDPMTIALAMVKENGKWVLDDFWPDKTNEYTSWTKPYCKKYILDEIEDFKSGETVKYMKENQHDEWYTDDHIDEVKNAFNEFIAHNKDFISKIK